MKIKCKLLHLHSSARFGVNPALLYKIKTICCLGGGGVIYLLRSCVFAVWKSIPR